MYLSCTTLCSPVDCSLPGSSVHGIFQARILDRVVISFPRVSSPPRDRTYISCIAGRFFITEPPGKPLAVMLDLRNPMSPQAWPVNALQQTLAACALLGGVSGTQLRGTIIISVFLLPRLFLNIWSFDYFTTFTYYSLQYSWAFLVTQLVKNLPAMWETWVHSLGCEDPLEKGKATHSSILSQRIPWTVLSMGL